MEIDRNPIQATNFPKFGTLCSKIEALLGSMEYDLLQMRDVFLYQNLHKKRFQDLEREFDNTNYPKIDEIIEYMQKHIPEFNNELASFVDSGKMFIPTIQILKKNVEIVKTGLSSLVDTGVLYIPDKNTYNTISLDKIYPNTTGLYEELKRPLLKEHKLFRDLMFTKIYWIAEDLTSMFNQCYYERFVKHYDILKSVYPELNDEIQKNNVEIIEFKELFEDSKDYEKALKMLKEYKTPKPFLNDHNEYIGKNKKPIFCCWYDLLENKGKIKKGISPINVAKLFEREFKGLKMTDSELRRCYSPKNDKIIKKEIERLYVYYFPK